MSGAPKPASDAAEERQGVQLTALPQSTRAGGGSAGEPNCPGLRRSTRRRLGATSRRNGSILLSKESARAGALASREMRKPSTSRRLLLAHRTRRVLLRQSAAGYCQDWTPRRSPATGIARAKDVETGEPCASCWTRRSVSASTLSPASLLASSGSLQTRGGEQKQRQHRWL